MSGDRLKVVAVSGSLRRPSRTRVLVDQLLAELGRVVPIDATVVEIAQLAPGFGSTLYRDEMSADARTALAAIEAADVLIAASPVYRASYSGLFKHLFDHVHQEALIDVPVLLAATGGSERHALAIDHQLRPLFGFFQARTLPIGVYATEGDFEAGALTSTAVKARIALAIQRAAPLLRRRRLSADAAAAIADSAVEA